MNQLTSVTALNNYTLLCTFKNSVQKLADITPYLSSEVFLPLNDIMLFNQVQNHTTYISWLNETIDLSADTLWHISK